MLGIAGSFTMQTCVRKNKGKEEIMTQSTVELASLAAKLSPSERLRLVETIFATLDIPAPEMAAAWANEAGDRLAAYKRGEILTVSEVEVFGDLDDRQ
jgi:putative addiction module component (TIGR02574 family)